MKRQRAYLILMAALVVALCAWLVGVAVSTYMATGGFTRETLAARLWPAVPLMLLIAALAVAGRLTGVRGWTVGPRPDARTAEAPAAPGRGRAILRAALIALAIGFIIAGACNGSMRDVLVKAVNICTECVGLG